MGFKDIIKDKETGIIFKADVNDLAHYIEKLIEDRNILKRINQNICNMDFKYVMDYHVHLIQSLYEKVIGVR